MKNTIVWNRRAQQLAFVSKIIPSRQHVVVKFPNSQKYYTYNEQVIGSAKQIFHTHTAWGLQRKISRQDWRVEQPVKLDSLQSIRILY